MPQKRARLGSQMRAQASAALKKEIREFKKYSLQPNEHKLNSARSGAKSTCLSTFRSYEVKIYLFLGFCCFERKIKKIKLDIVLDTKLVNEYMKHLSEQGCSGNYLSQMCKVISVIIKYIGSKGNGAARKATALKAYDQVAGLGSQWRHYMAKEHVDLDVPELPSIQAYHLFCNKVEAAMLDMLRTVIREATGITLLPDDPGALMELALTSLSGLSLKRDQAFLLEATAMLCLCGGRGMPPLRPSAIISLQWQPRTFNRCHKICKHEDCIASGCRGNRIEEVEGEGEAGNGIAVVLPHHKTANKAKGGQQYRRTFLLPRMPSLLIQCSMRLARPVLLGNKMDSEDRAFVKIMGSPFKLYDVSPWLQKLIKEYGAGLLEKKLCVQNVRNVWVGFLRQKDEQEARHLAHLRDSGIVSHLHNGASIMGNSVPTCLRWYDSAASAEKGQSMVDGADELHALFLNRAQRGGGDAGQAVNLRH